MKIEMNREVRLGPAIAKKIAATTGSTATRRKSLSASRTAAPTQAPTHALRVKVTATATASAGMTRIGHNRSRRPNRIRASAQPIASISRPE